MIFPLFCFAWLIRSSWRPSPGFSCYVGRGSQVHSCNGLPRGGLTTHLQRWDTEQAGELSSGPHISSSVGRVHTCLPTPQPVDRSKPRLSAKLGEQPWLRAGTPGGTPSKHTAAAVCSVFFLAYLFFSALDFCCTLRPLLCCYPADRVLRRHTVPQAQDPLQPCFWHQLPGFSL